MSFEYTGMGFYKVRDGKRALVCTAPDGALIGLVLGWDRHDSDKCNWHKDGTALTVRPGDYDLISEWQDPIEVKGWIPITGNGTVCMTAYRTKKLAFEHRPGVVDAIYVTGIQGVEPNGGGNE